MLKRTSKFRPALIMVLGLLLLCSGAFAQGKDSRESREKRYWWDTWRGQEDRNWWNGRGERHYYRDGRWYKRGWFRLEFPVSALVAGALVESLPPNCSVIVIGDTAYYYDNEVYYRKLADGAYVVVPAPR